METLAETPWDVIIAGTGLAQSLLALALSRSGKKILHLDKNPYYGGSEAAFSLEEAQEWMEHVRQRPGQSPFEDATIFTSQDPHDSPRSLNSQDSQDCSISSERPAGTPDIRPKLAPSRSYTLSLSPYFLYTRSQLISALISSKVYRQLEFLAVGSWWIYSPEHPDAENSEPGATNVLYRVPGNREDVFADTHISTNSKRTLMRFLRHVSKPPQDEDSSTEEEELSMPFEGYLNSKFEVPRELHDSLLSLSLSQLSLQETSAAFAVPRVKRHLASIGALGPGFGGVISKWGGASEILQVACRACAVGGGVYALDTAIQSLTEDDGGEEHPVKVQLSRGDLIRTKFVVGSFWDLPSPHDQPVPCSVKVARSITVVSSTFASLFPVTVEGAPTPASAVLMFPGTTLRGPESPPVYLQVHSSDTGECPRQQSVIYGSVSLGGAEGQSLLECAVDRLLRAEGPHATVLWSMRYTQLGRMRNDSTPPTIYNSSPHVLSFPPSNLDLAFEDEVVEMVKEAWKRMMGDQASSDDFMSFNDRGGASDG